MIIYRENFTLNTDIVDLDLEASGGWTPDCQGKQDYDPEFLKGCSRVYPDGSYACSIYIGETEIVSTDILKADSVEAAKSGCERWMEEKGKIIRAAVEAALKEGRP